MTEERPHVVLTELPPPRPVAVAAAMRRAEPLLARRPLLVVSDFDGTLSLIVQDPWAAAILPAGRRALRALAGLPDVHVAVLSGRTAADVAGRVRAGGVTYLGNHGIERGFLSRRVRAEALRAVIRGSPEDAAAMSERLAREVPRLVPEPWLVVERKPPAVAFHYRAAPDLQPAAARLRAVVDQLDPDHLLERVPARRVLELRPPGSIAKGEAMHELLADFRPAAAFMLGDDVSDALAFEVLRKARDAGATEGLAIAVQAHAEAPPDVARAADLLLASPVDAVRFLSGLARRAAIRPPETVAAPEDAVDVLAAGLRRSV